LSPPYGRKRKEKSDGAEWETRPKMLAVSLKELLDKRENKKKKYRFSLRGGADARLF
jgi:hypothetical protein